MKEKLQRLLRPALVVVVALAALGLLGFAARSTNTTPVKELAVAVDAPEGVHFIDENQVRENVLAMSNGLIGTRIGDVDIVGIEEKLRSIGCVARVNAYHTMDGVMHVTVKQREPIVRVINNDGTSFYIDREGWTMPLSANYTARVLVVTGMLFEPFVQGAPVDLLHASDSLKQATHSDEIFQLARTITADPFWNALFDQAVVDATGEFDLIPRIGGQRVKVGDGEHLAARLVKLKNFYDQGIPRTDWRMYSVIDTRFTDQVVCTRRADYKPAPKKRSVQIQGNVSRPSPGVAPTR